MKYLVLAVAIFATACGGGPTGPVGLVRFADRDINLGAGDAGQFQLTNTGSEPLTGVTFRKDATVDDDGVAVEGGKLTVLFGAIQRLDPGRKFSFPFIIDTVGLAPGKYSLVLRVLVDGEESDRATIRFVKPEPR